MNKYRGIPKKKIEVVFNGIEVDSFNYPSTSEIKISVLIDGDYLELAVRALHAAYGLDQE